jgi:sugar phosphate permease
MRVEELLSQSGMCYGFHPSVGRWAFLFWGWMTDRIARSGDPLPALRRLFLLLTVSSLPLAATARVNSYPITLAILFGAMVIIPGFNIGALAYVARHYPMNHSGLIAGLASRAWSAVVAVEMPLVGKLFDLHWYDAAFALATLFPVLGYWSWRALDRGKP